MANFFSLLGGTRFFEIPSSCKKERQILNIFEVPKLKSRILGHLV